MQMFPNAMREQENPKGNHEGLLLQNPPPTTRLKISLFCDIADYDHHLGIASFYINDDSKEMALNNNVMVLQRKGDEIETIVPPMTLSKNSTTLV
jgi:hypothetical protein